MRLYEVITDGDGCTELQPTIEHYKNAEAFRAHVRKNSDKYPDGAVWELHGEHVVRIRPRKQTRMVFDE